MEKSLEVQNLRAGYGSLHILLDVVFHVVQGEFVALLGPNGAGKTTVLRTIAGLLQPTHGTIRCNGELVSGLNAHEISRRGISFVSEESNLFLGMSVLENLLLGAYAIHDRRQIPENLELVLELFPVLKERRKQLAGTLSGGERKMLGLGRGLMAKPRILLVDEPSLGLAPRVVDLLFEALRILNRDGMSILLVEQNVSLSLEVTSRGYVLEQGRVVIEGASDELLGNDHVRRTYLGIA